MKNQSIYQMKKTPLLFVRENEESAAAPVGGGRQYTEAEFREAMTRARQEERTRLNDSLSTERRERETAQQQLRQATEEQERLRLAGQAPDQILAGQIANLSRTVEVQTQQLSQLRNENRATYLAAYRERTMRAFGLEIIHEMVNGSTEEELDASALLAHKEYKRLEAEFQQKLARGVQDRLGFNPFDPAITAASLQPGTPVQVPVTPTVTLPANPAYVAPATAGGFPTPTNPGPVVEEQAGAELSFMTTEEAVRSGAYRGEMRQRILAGVKGAPYTPNLGNSPRHLPGPSVAHQAMPGEVSQPVGNPTGPVNPAHVPAQPRGVPAPPQTAGNPVASQSAAEAIARTRAGQNPTAGDPTNMGVQSAVSELSAHQTRPGAPQNSQDAYAGRFQPTPPAQAQ